MLLADREMTRIGFDLVCQPAGRSSVQLRVVARPWLARPGCQYHGVDNRQIREQVEVLKYMHGTSTLLLDILVPSLIKPVRFRDSPLSF